MKLSELGLLIDDPVIKRHVEKVLKVDRDSLYGPSSPPDKPVTINGVTYGPVPCSTPQGTPPNSPSPPRSPSPHAPSSGPPPGQCHPGALPNRPTPDPASHQSEIHIHTCPRSCFLPFSQPNLTLRPSPTPTGYSRPDTSASGTTAVTTDNSTQTSFVARTFGPFRISRSGGRGSKGRGNKGRKKESEEKVREARKSEDYEKLMDALICTILGLRLMR